MLLHCTLNSFAFHLVPSRCIAKFVRICCICLIGTKQTFDLFLILPQISIPLSTAFGVETEGAQWIVGYLLEKVINNLSVWSSEADLAIDTVDLLVTLVEKRER